jgi:competence protein ComEC
VRTGEAPAALPLIAYAAGLACGHSHAEAAGFAAIAILLLALRRVRMALVCFALAGGVCMAAHLAHVRDADDRVLAALPADEFAVVEAPISRDWSPRGDSFLLRCDSFRIGGREFDRPLLVAVRFAPPPMAMQRTIRVEGFLRRGDLEVVAVKSAALLRYEGALPPWTPAAWNRALNNRLRTYVSVWPNEVALVQAIALGRAEALDAVIRTSYKRGGTYHLLVFSGLQIAFAAALIAMLLRWFGAPRTSDWSLLAFSIAAPLFIGPTASVSRASIGIGLYAATRILRRPTTLENLWCVAALLRLIVAPADLTDAAFHLTFAGAGALLFAGKALAQSRWRLLTCALAAELAITPLTLFHFHQYALGGSLTTLVLTPVVFVMLVVSALACAAPCDLLFALIAELNRIGAIVNAAGSIGSGFFAAPPLAAMIAGYLVAMFAIACLRGRLRAMAILVSLSIPSIAALIVGTRDVDAPHLVALDVGQGDAILLRAPGRAVLVDAGPESARIVTQLADRGVRRLDVAVLTHVHPDHCGGMPAVLENLRVGEIWISPRRFRGDCAERIFASGVPIRLLRDGEAHAIGPFTLRALLTDTTFRRASENNASVVLRVAIGRVTALLTGDVEREAEAALSERAIRAEILKVPHHGSRSSSTDALLDAVSPRVALISCGRANAFGHPHPDVLARLVERGVRTWRTDRLGAIDVEVRGPHVLVRTQFDTPP